jgi:RND family efflux transporter MFP subunit
MIGSAPIYSVVDEPRAESAAWAKFSNARDNQEFCTAWLAILCMQIDRVSGGILLLGPDKDGAFAPAAIWPHPAVDVQYLSAAAERTLKERRGIVVAEDSVSAPSREQRAYVGYPIEASGTLHGAVVLDLAPGPDAALQRALRLLHWASAWLIDRFRRRLLEEREAQIARMAVAMDLIATAVQEPRSRAAALAIANEAAARLACERVSVGLYKSGSIQVHAISHTATFDRKMDLARMIGEAMDEVLDQDTALIYPPRNENEIAASAHAQLAHHFRDIAVCSVSLVDNDETIGVLTLERTEGQPFEEDTIELCKTLGILLGPVLRLKRENERGILYRLGHSGYRGAAVLFGPRHPGAKLIALTAAAIIAFFYLTSGTYRVSAKTVIEGAVQRAAAAPYDGYIRQSFARAGDVVRNGDVLFRLDDRDLKLEQARLVAEREQLARKHRQALAGQDRAAMVVLAAQMDQTDAQLDLVKERLARATARAPFDGIVVSGDLSQLLGTPVEQGKVLFQIAPLNDYRIVLEVDERDVNDVKVGQSGELTLSGMPDQHMPFVVRQMTPVSTSQEGKNYFRVEAQLENLQANLRPGMEGIGKIVVGQRKLIWIWTRGLVDWLRFSAWKWMP